MLGDAFASLAMPLLVLQCTGSVQQMGAVTATYWTSQLAAGLFSGAVVDGVNRRLLMIACNVGLCLTYALMPLGWGLFGPRNLADLIW